MEWRRVCFHCCLSILGGPHVTITHHALGHTVQSPLPTWHMGLPWPHPLPNPPPSLSSVSCQWHLVVITGDLIVQGLGFFTQAVTFGGWGTYDGHVDGTYPTETFPCFTLNSLNSANIQTFRENSIFSQEIRAGADPGFAVGWGANPPGRGANLQFWQNFPKNSMKLRKFWTVGGRAPGAPPLRSATAGGGVL